MGARRCGVEHEKGVPYLRASMYYFVYHVSIFLTRRSRHNSRFKKRTRCHLFMALTFKNNVLKTFKNEEEWCFVFWNISPRYSVFVQKLLTSQTVRMTAINHKIENISKILDK